MGNCANRQALEECHCDRVQWSHASLHPSLVCRWVTDWLLIISVPQCPLTSFVILSQESTTLCLKIYSWTLLLSALSWNSLLESFKILMQIHTYLDPNSMDSRSLRVFLSQVGHVCPHASESQWERHCKVLL